MEKVVKALVLSAADAGENDKLAVLLTDGEGKLRAKLRGVKKPNARLKFASQPFCFMDAVLHERSGFYTVINATPLDLFYSIVTDLDKLYAASVVLEGADALTRWGGGGELLPAALSALSAFSYGDGGLKLCAARFLSESLVASGYRLELERCILCGRPVATGPVGFDLGGGGVKCSQCAGDKDRSMRADTLRALRAIRETAYEDLPSLALPESAVIGALNAYNRAFEWNFSKKLNTVSQLVRR